MSRQEEKKSKAMGANISHNFLRHTPATKARASSTNQQYTTPTRPNCEQSPTTTQNSRIVPSNDIKPNWNGGDRSGFEHPLGRSRVIENALHW